MNKYVQITDYNEDEKELIAEAAGKGDINAYIKDPVTQKLIKVHPNLIKKMKSGITVTIQDILNYKLN